MRGKAVARKDVMISDLYTETSAQVRSRIVALTDPVLIGIVYMKSSSLSLSCLCWSNISSLNMPS